LASFPLPGLQREKMGLKKLSEAFVIKKIENFSFVFKSTLIRIISFFSQ